MRWLRERSRRRHCPHLRVRGIYGDEINHTPGGRRLECWDCGRLLDGPVRIAEVRQREHAEVREVVKPVRDEAALALLKADPQAFFDYERRQRPRDHL
ncbi:hypothetical protein DW322_11195 [Rhodococcus rhodnii]|uniref:Uncharacterized protein n=2 Tax=Rhodococcus rhodnii TaxID=38312 RepID=R7WV74_9NOCA|nr:hypothetical protein [Rhodococcus rhodnii]EOM78049.1 hypothetical protein Rrhod_0590 [Rhodococcus rhodnii LMG 5362]TXG90677.1 hypothetical protein DW322_11195 [Rhodococcus rhodnii]